MPDLPSLTAADAPASATVARPVRWVLRSSDAVLAAERHVLGGFMTLLVLLILLNVVTRYAGLPLYWVDEASVYAVVWLTFVGASIMTRLRLDFAVGLLTEHLSPKAARIAKVLSTAGVLVFGLSMLAMCWSWMDPVGIARHHFDAREYAAETFNFLYTEHTQTLEWPVWVLQLIMPLFSFTLSLHALANLLEDLEFVPRRTFPEFHVGNSETVN
ncbi:TRAP-type C4-dicarboxylate transport system, small permease component [Cupriavidus sp. YR651]|uniref:TRAP transporter small permease n=1 Tax=Cupriavidus sp. YR651 TaxID=1855315 RepID=UPI000880C78B|nr:TRAP transporter small permease [Cupriavidus sp. YR651]SDC66083.1 TRAP-type C4-dicarboxylate transport system, small permease component [Cupriavidus sp. YR651]